MDRWNLRNAKKNILSSWRGKNGPRSGNRWRQRRKSAKSWRNTAAERKYLFLRRRKETESEDKQIYKMLESLDFYFGGKTYKVAEAGLMFSYEIGREGRQLYIVALTVNFGTIIFYIPESVEDKIRKRVQQLPYTLDDYLSFLVEFKDFEPIVIPLRKCGISISEAAAALGGFALAAARAGTSLQDASAAFKALGSLAVDCEEKSNNWLKMHGFPMRRKGKGKKKHE